MIHRLLRLMTAPPPEVDDPPPPDPLSPLLLCVASIVFIIIGAVALAIATDMIREAWPHIDDSDGRIAAYEIRAATTANVITIASVVVTLGALLITAYDFQSKAAAERRKERKLERAQRRRELRADMFMRQEQNAALMKTAKAKEKAQAEKDKENRDARKAAAAAEARRQAEHAEQIAADLITSLKSFRFVTKLLQLRPSWSTNVIEEAGLLPDTGAEPPSSASADASFASSPSPAKRDPSLITTPSTGASAGRAARSEAASFAETLPQQSRARTPRRSGKELMRVNFACYTHSLFKDVILTYSDGNVRSPYRQTTIRYFEQVFQRLLAVAHMHRANTFGPPLGPVFRLLAFRLLILCRSLHHHVFDPEGVFHGDVYQKVLLKFGIDRLDAEEIITFCKTVVDVSQHERRPRRPTRRDTM